MKEPFGVVFLKLDNVLAEFLKCAKVSALHRLPFLLLGHRFPLYRSHVLIRWSD